MSLNLFLEKLTTAPESIEFSETMAVIEDNYEFSETPFSNGLQKNSAGQNSGSCKIFAFAQLHNLSEAQALACFGIYYRNDVLQHPQGDDHQNIRQFIINGWQGIEFSSAPLTVK
ncbi:HopJ type III effector protein [Psychromonas ossibalaenae]|uniref:HopJ type III effector protein n=1 Tax=Psychromonas ossibalaenae TaxID=444922 RepID=UPI00037EF615|nr:HopJ type III effector protein [Psychromonas ossibalaenae]